MKYRKKPVVIDAIKWDPFNMLIKDVMDFMEVSSKGMADLGILSIGKYKGELVIKTLEGDMTVMEGDYIIRGVAGEFYPCKPDIFAATYEVVE